ncbi:MAG: S8 family serine peptidase [Bacteroidota bacterium]
MKPKFLQTSLLNYFSFLLLFVSSLLTNLLLAQDFLSVRFINAADVPTQSGNSWVFPDPDLNHLLQDYNLTNVVQRYPAAEGVDHSYAEPLTRVYRIECDCDVTDLGHTLSMEAQSWIDLVEELEDVQSMGYTPNDYGVPWQRWHLDEIFAEDAWELTKGDPTIKIAIVEPGGFDIAHEELVNKIHSTSGTMSNSSFQYRNHGTTVSSAAAAETDNDLGLASIGFDCSLMLYQGASLSNMIEAAKNGANVINTSWGRVTMSQTDQQCVQLIRDVYGTVLVAGAGNGNDDTGAVGDGLGYKYPASYDGVISVSSANKFLQLKHVSQNEELYHTHNDKVDILSPGFEIYLAEQDDNYAVGRGTSFASPIVAGVIGLMLSVNPCLHPDDVEAILKDPNNSTDISSVGCPGDPTFPSDCNADYYSAGAFPRFVNAEAAVLAAMNFVGEDEYILASQGPQVWDTDRRLTGDLIIASGAELTITAEIRMSAEKTIKVERGGRLIVDGGVIDVVNSPCKEPWHGIHVWGDRSLPHPSEADLAANIHPNHGLVRLLNGARLRNSRDAITLGRYEPWGWYAAYSGGIVQASNAVFENNRRSVAFTQFEPSAFNANHSDDNASFFASCTFRHTGETNFSHNSLAAFVSLWRVHGVDFIANTFENADPSAFDFQFQGTGIYSDEASYNVHGDCALFLPNGDCAQWYPNRFEELDIGIRANGAKGPLGVVDISNSEFVRCREGAVICGVWYAASITDNYFELPSDRPTEGSGLYLKDSRGFLVEGNYFTQDGGGSLSSPLNTSIQVSNSGSIANEIYRNHMEDITIGVKAEKLNRKANDPNVGLQIKCNVFNTIVGWNIASLDGGIPNQGFCFDATSPAGNVLSHDCTPLVPGYPPTLNGDVLHDAGTFSDIDYAHHDGIAYEPICKSIYVHNVQCVGYDKNLSCQSTLGGNKVAQEQELLDELDALDAVLASSHDPEVLSYSLHKRQIGLGRLVRLYLSDFRRAELLTYLASDQTQQGKMIRVSLLIATHSFDEAQTVLNGFVPEEEEEIQWQNLQQWMIDIFSSGREYEDMTETEESSLRNIAASGLPSSGKAQVILEKVFGEPVPFPYGPIPRTSRKQESPELFSESFPRLYPNPGSDYITVDLEPSSQPIQIQVYEVSGKKVLETKVEDLKSKIPVHQLSTGVYLWVCEREGTVIKREKIFIVR